MNNSDFILGSNVDAFENSINEFSGSAHTISTANGTDALILSLKYLRDKFPEKNEIITTPLSYLASTSSIMLNRLKPVFADIDETLNINPEEVEKKITERTLCILFVHYSGNPSNLGKIIDLGDSYEVPVIEDCAQAFGATFKGVSVGINSFAGCVSLHPLKMLSCMGDGGFIMTQDSEFSSFVRKARNHGHISRDDIEMWSINSRLDSIQAGIALSQMNWFKNELITRRRQYKIYHKRLPSLMFPKVDDAACPSLNWLVLLANDRQKLSNHLSALGIETKVHYPLLIPEMTAAKSEFDCSSLTKAISMKKKIVSIPIGSHITDDRIEEVCDAINDFYG